jgi:hypothetical protein
MTMLRRWQAPWQPLLLVATLTGCVVQKQLPPTQVAEGEKLAAAETSRAQVLIAKLEQKARALSSLQTDAVMDYSQGAKHLKAREQLTLRRPQSLRLEVYYAFGVALVLVSNGAQIQVFEPSNDVLLYARSSAVMLDRFAHVPLGPRQAVNLLMGLSPDSGVGTQSSLSYVRREGATLIAGCRAPDGSAIELGFADSELALARERERDGALRYEVGYGDYRDVGGISLAHQIVASFPSSGAAVKFSYKHAVLNRVFDNSLFVLSPGPATRAIDLDRQTG